MNYRCRLSDSRGKITNQIIQADNDDELIASVSNKGYFLIKYEEQKQRGNLRGKQTRAVLELTQSLSLMIESGLTLKEAFEVASNLFTKGKTAQLVSQLNDRLRKGESFSQAIESNRELFPPLYLGMIKVGQKLGHLDRILPSLSDWLENRKELRDRINAALLYPAMVLLLVFVGVIALVLFFLPYMEEMMVTAGDGMTNNLTQAYNSARNLIFIFTALVLFIPMIRLVFMIARRKSQTFLILLDSIKLRIPFLKTYFMTSDMLSLSFALSVLTQCGVPLEDAIIQASEVLENSFLKQRLIKIQGDLLKGSPLSSLLGQETIFPREFSRWVGLGESIGKTDRVFDQLRIYYQKEMDKILNRILTLVEPVIIIILGLLLIVIILNVILPLLTMYGGLA